MKVLVTGGSGFIGQELCQTLQQQGYEVLILDLLPPRQSFEFFKIDLIRQVPPPELFQGVVAIIHLAGRNIFGRWSRRVKKEIYQSRVQGTRNLISVLESLPTLPRVLVSASAVGFYGNRGEEDLDEASNPGQDFLAQVCVAWEREARAAESFGLRAVQIRTAPVLGNGGLLSKLLPVYKLGLGGPLGRGEQWFPWIHIRDIVNCYIFALENPNLSGPVNACSPKPVRNKEFASILAQVLHRPAWLRLPPWTLQLIFKDLAKAITASQKVYPKKLTQAGYQFLFPDLKKALEDILW